VRARNTACARSANLCANAAREMLATKLTASFTERTRQSLDSVAFLRHVISFHRESRCRTMQSCGLCLSLNIEIDIRAAHNVVSSHTFVSPLLSKFSFRHFVRKILSPFLTTSQANVGRAPDLIQVLIPAFQFQMPSPPACLQHLIPTFQLATLPSTRVEWGTADH
jgi:hypothetical protein